LLAMANVRASRLACGEGAGVFCRRPKRSLGGRAHAFANHPANGTSSGVNGLPLYFQIQMPVRERRWGWSLRRSSMRTGARVSKSWPPPELVVRLRRSASAFPAARDFCSIGWAGNISGRATRWWRPGLRALSHAHFMIKASTSWIRCTHGVHPGRGCCDFCSTTGERAGFGGFSRTMLSRRQGDTA